MQTLIRGAAVLAAGLALTTGITGCGNDADLGGRSDGTVIQSPMPEPAPDVVDPLPEPEQDDFVDALPDDPVVPLPEPEEDGILEPLPAPDPDPPLYLPYEPHAPDDIPGTESCLYGGDPLCDTTIEVPPPDLSPWS